ncbi:hypothetical protein Sjap_022516 [Stephania japonica]|uniref:Protein kinase domain-containing protein n=1 Tax=Stephania japonica TaxID=461633 RepID=A0AAP0HSX4_9MAGN
MSSSANFSYTLLSSILFFSIFFFFVPHVNSLYFKFSSFASNSPDILYGGDAVFSMGSIDFTSMDYLARVGRATYANQVRTWDSRTGKLTDFTTHFSFFIDTRGSQAYSDGLVFFIAPVGFQIPSNSAGEFLGLFNTTTSGDNSINHIIFVEFDTHWNAKWDPQGVDNHVGINVNSLSSVKYAPWNASLYSGKTANVWITYNATTKNMSVFWTYNSTYSVFQESDAILAHTIDLKEVLPEWAIVGFSASTGIVMERHVLQSWEFNSSLDEKETQGQTVKRTDKLIIGLGVPLVVLIVGVFGAALMIQRRRRRGRKVLGEEMTNNTSITNDLERGAGPKKFSYRQLTSATNNFSDIRKLGEGGFGCVYKGFLRELNLTVAVKRISRGSKQGKKEYITEVKTISQLRHRNLVRLIGWCHDKGEFLLVYEFMPNGSLDAHLFGKKAPLDWNTRYKISLGLASALLYLHEEWEQCVVHRDIKSSNVMLDSNFNAKLGDFGLARLMDHELGPKTTGLAGTLGYLAPEYISTGKASKESDVFSFGVVALEMACGRKSVDQIEEESLEVGFVEWIWGLYGSGRLSVAMDDKLVGEDLDMKQVERLMIVGLWCAHPDRSLRPSVRQAIQVLKLEAELPELPPSMPMPLYQLPNLAFPVVPEVSSYPASLSTSLDVGR